MGFWSGLAKIGAGIAAPFTGGASLLAIPAIDALSQNAGSQAGAAATGRIAQAQAQNAHDQNALNFYNAAHKNALQDPATLTRQAAAGDMLSNLQDVSIGGLPSYIHVPQISGGTRPSNLGPNARQAGQQLSRNALLQLTQNKFNLPSMPNQTPLPSQGGWENAMSWLGRAGSLASPTLSILNGIQNRPPSAMPMPDSGAPNLPYQPPQFGGWAPPDEIQAQQTVPALGGLI